jgi:hypothetical protein
MTVPTRLARPALGAVLALLLALPVLLAAGPARAAAPPATPVPYYVVAQSFNGQPEFLFEIAQRLLGSGDRANEIFQLNVGRAEPGGLRVERPEVIRPGWVLQLPPDAHGNGVRVGPLPTFGPGTATPTGAATSAPAQQSAPAPRPAPAAATSGAGGGVPALALWLPLAAAVVALAGLLTWAGRTGRLAALNPGRLRRKRSAAPPHPDTSASWTVDRSLRVLAASCAGQRRPLPGVYAVVVGAEQIRLRLSAPDEMPPAGWSAEHDGRTWVADLRDLQYAAVDDTRPEPYERLVTLGTTADGRLLLNLAQARGIIAVQGDAAMQRGLVDQWARELAGNPWSRQVAVLGAGFGSGFGAGHRARWLPDLAQLWDCLAEVPAGVLLLARAPSGRDLARLSELAASPGLEWTVVVLGGAKQARWQFTVRPGGWLDTGFLPEPIRTGLDTGQPATV